MADANTAAIPNPVMCIEESDTVVFTIDDYDHYPVFVPDSVLNSNDNFDYGPFINMATNVESKKLNGDTDKVIFAFTFTEGGTYMFQDKTETDSYLLVVVAGESQRCPDDTAYIQPMTARSLSSEGAAQDEDIILELDTPLLIALCVALGLLITVTMLSVAWCLHR